ncbi:hypothetical protein M0R36_05100 [bacterium]|jgi:hypothetical protein|nr:hypothetical protein [bacterium]
MKKLCLYFILPVLLSVVLLWVAANWYFIPRKLVPFFEKKLPSLLPEGIEVDYSKIIFSPFTGFMICDFRIIADGSEIISAGELDVDLAILPLLRKKIVVSEISESDVQINIRRDENGKWNISKALDSDFLEESSFFGEWEFRVGKLHISTCRINFVDVYRAENSLEKRLEGITLKASSPDENVYRFEINSPVKNAGKEDISVNIDYDQDKKSFSGSLKGKTKALESYWDYYIDEFFHPWKMNTEETGIEINFFSCKQYFSLQGNYNFGKIALQYGDVSYKGDILIEQDFKHGKSDKIKSYNRVDLVLKNAGLSAGETEIFQKAYCRVMSQDDIAMVEDFSGDVFGEPASFNGQVHLSKPRKVKLQGKAFSMNNVFDMEMSDDDKAKLEWKGNLQGSFFSLSARSNDLKNMDFTADAAGMLQVEEFLDNGRFSGKAEFRLAAAGELDKLESLNGKGDITFKKLDLNKIKVDSAKAGILIKDGVGEIKIGSAGFYSGNMKVMARVDLCVEPVRWGTEIDLNKVDMAELDESIREAPTGSKGTLSGKLACVGFYGKEESIKGGGYFDIRDDILWEMPMFKETEEGIKDVVQNIEIPKLDDVTGNFHIEDCKISTQNTYCRSKTMEMWINGWIDFSGHTDMVVGVRFGKEGIMRIISMPVNILAECIQVHIRGSYPDFKHTAEIKPIGWLFSIFPRKGKKADTKKYTLEKLWEQAS